MDKSKLMLIIIIVLLVLLLGTVAGVTFFIVGMSGGGGNEVVIEDVRPAPGQFRLTELEIIELGDDIITTHLLRGDDGRPATVRTVVQVGMDVSHDESDAFRVTFNNRILAARAIAIEVLNGLTYEEVRTPEGQGAAAEIIMRRLQDSFETNLIVTVHFSDWMVAQGR